MNTKLRGDFTLPGEAGYEKLTLELAKKWGADVIRDSDGTKLSPEITEAGYRIYSTICIIREHNDFAEAHPDPPDFLSASLKRFDGPPDEESLALFAQGLRARGDARAEADYEKRLRRRAAVCLRLTCGQQPCS